MAKTMAADLRKAADNIANGDPFDLQRIRTTGFREPQPAVVNNNDAEMISVLPGSDQSLLFTAVRDFGNTEREDRDSKWLTYPLRAQIEELCDRVGATTSGAIMRLLGLSAWPARSKVPTPQDMRDGGTVYSSTQPAKSAAAIVARLKAAYDEGYRSVMEGRTAKSLDSRSSFAKSLDLAFELSRGGRLDELTYREIVKWRDLIVRATPSARSNFKSDPGYRKTIGHIRASSISDQDKETIIKSLQ